MGSLNGASNGLTTKQKKQLINKVLRFLYVCAVARCFDDEVEQLDVQNNHLLSVSPFLSA